MAAHQAPPSLGFSRQEYWSGLPFPSPGDLPDPGIKPGSPALLQADAFYQLSYEGTRLLEFKSLLYCAFTVSASYLTLSSVQFSLVSQSCPTLCDLMNCSTPGLPVHHQLPEFTQTHVYQVGDAIQPSHPLSSPSPPALNPSQHQSLFQ